MTELILQAALSYVKAHPEVLEQLIAEAVKLIVGELQKKNQANASGILK